MSSGFVVFIVLLKNIMKSTCGIKTANDDKFISQEKKDEDSYLFLRGRNLQKWLKPENETLEYIWYKPELMKENINARPRSLENFYVDEKILIKEIGDEIVFLHKNSHFLITFCMSLIIRYIVKLKKGKITPLTD